MVPVIICGGVGTKMWPESSPKHPKHFLPLVDGRSLFELNWEMLRKKFLPEKIFLQTNAEQAKIAKELVAEIVDDNILIEPEMRNQGPATGFAAAVLIKKGLGEEPFMLIQTDLLRKDEESFLGVMGLVGELVRQKGAYVTGGMRPKTIVGGVDYLVKGEVVGEFMGVKIYRVADYIDRSEEEKLKSMMGSDKLLLHWNHTAIKPVDLLKMYQTYKPEWYGPLAAIAAGSDPVVEYGKMIAGPIEEVTANVHKRGESLVMEFPFEIWDFGTWKSMAEYEGEKKSENLIEIDGSNNYVRSKKPVGIIGLSDLCVIESEGGVLVCPKSESGRVGEIVKVLAAKTTTG